MTKAHKLTGILALLALCACASNQGTTTPGTTGGASATPGTPTGTTAPSGPATTDTTPGTTTPPPPSTTGTSAEGKGQTDCSAVRCMSCPTGQHPALTPPDCCRCVPG